MGTTPCPCCTLFHKPRLVLVGYPITGMQHVIYTTRTQQLFFLVFSQHWNWNNTNIVIRIIRTRDVKREVILYYYYYMMLYVVQYGVHECMHLFFNRYSITNTTGAVLYAHMYRYLCLYFLLIPILVLPKSKYVQVRNSAECKSAGQKTIQHKPNLVMELNEINK